MARKQITLNDPSRFKDPANLTWERYVALQARERERYLAERAAIPAEAMAYQTVSPRYLELAVGAEASGDICSAVNHRARVRDETRHISFARALVRALIDDDPSNLDVIQRWQDDSLQLFVEVARGGERRDWWEGFLTSYYKIALPLGLRPSTLPV